MSGPAGDGGGISGGSDTDSEAGRTPQASHVMAGSGGTATAPTNVTQTGGPAPQTTTGNQLPPEAQQQPDQARGEGTSSTLSEEQGSSSAENQATSSRPHGPPTGGPDGTAAAPMSGAIANIVANSPLPERDFPNNRPAIQSEALSLTSYPRMISTVRELETIIKESRGQVYFSNFADVSPPSSNASTPVYPTLSRFGGMRFATAGLDRFMTVPTTPTPSGNQTDSGAILDLAFPTKLQVTDSKNMPIPGLPIDGHPDCQGYPLFFRADRGAKKVRARSSGALYHTGVSRIMAQRLVPLPDNNTVRAWSSMFSLTNDRDAQSILMQRVVGASHGDNHIALLVKAYLHYFDSIAAALEDVEPRRKLVTAEAHVMNVTQQNAWTSQVLRSGSEIVNVLDGTDAYQEFWAYCCFNSPPIFASRATEAGAMGTTQFSNYDMAAQFPPMIALCTFDAHSNTRQPEFWGRPNLILGFIEMYVQRYALQLQANEALQIAMMWPTLCEMEAHVSLPRSFHTADWFGGETERSSIDTSYRDLMASSPFVVLASTLAAPLALRSQIYDYLTLISSNRSSWHLSRDTIAYSLAWFANHISAPGLGWDFLLRHQFHVTASFLYLTGLNDQIVDWNTILMSRSWKEAMFPAHIRLLQAFLASASVCSILPWDKPWFPEFEMSGQMLQATPATIMRMIRLGLLGGNGGNGNATDATGAESSVGAAPATTQSATLPTGSVGYGSGSGIYPLLARDGLSTIRIAPGLDQQLRVVREHGIRVLALADRFDRDDAPRAFKDPTDNNRVQERWSFAGLISLLGSAAAAAGSRRQERGGDAMMAQIRPYSNPAMANPVAVDAASVRLAAVKERLAQVAITAANETTNALVKFGRKSFVDVTKEGQRAPTVAQSPSSKSPEANEENKSGNSVVALVHKERPVYSPTTSGDCGWWCALFLLRFRDRNECSMAHLRGIVDRAISEASRRIGTLSVDDMAGLCAILQLCVAGGISSSSQLLAPINLADDATTGEMLPFALRLADEHWTVHLINGGPTLRSDGNDFLPRLPAITNMPPHRNADAPLDGDRTARNDACEVDEHRHWQADAAFDSLDLATRCALLDLHIRRWDTRVESTQNVIRYHQLLFPGVGLPRFLKSYEGEPDHKSNGDIDDAAATSGQKHSHAADVRPIETSVDHKATGEAMKSTTGKTSNSNADKNKHHSSANVISAFLARHATTSAGFEAFCKAIAVRNNHESFDAAAIDAVFHIEDWPPRSAGHEGKNNLTVPELVNALDPTTAPQEELALWFVWTHRGNHSEFVTAVGLWLAGLDICPAAWTELLEVDLLFANEDTWLARSTDLHEAWRKNGLQRGCTCSKCWAQLLYPQALWGRGGVTVEWEKELSKKASVPDDIVAYDGHVWSAKYASELIRSTVREVLVSASQKLTVDGFDTFMDRAYEWLVNGSAAGMQSVLKKDVEVRQAVLKLYGLQPYATKRSVMETIPREHVLSQLRSRPQIIAKIHQKLNETGGKARAIYGVTLWHYIFSNWLMAPFERAIDHDNIDINIPPERFLNLQIRRAQAARQGACFSSYDYPDFNSMHTHYHMAMIYCEAAQIFSASKTAAVMAPSDVDLVRQGYAWLEDAVYSQVCYLPDTDQLIQTVGGLYSGNRDTTLINTILNIAYAKVIDTSCRNMYVDPRVNWRLCHGDDIISQHGTYGSALAWNAVANHANLKGQEQKLLTDRSFHEYLRILGCPDGKLRGSLARVCATFVNGNWETDYTPGAYAKMVELESAMSVLLRRGLRPAFAVRLWTTAVNRVISRIDPLALDAPSLISTVRMTQQSFASLLASDRVNASSSLSPTTAATTTATSRPSVTSSADIPSNVTATTPNVGDSNATNATVLDAIYVDNERRTQDTIEQHFAHLPDEVTRPYVRMLFSRLPLALRRDDIPGRLKKILQKSTYGTELPSRFSIEMKQTPQLTRHSSQLATAVAKRGRSERRVDMNEVGRVLGEHKLFATTLRRIKAFSALLSVTDDLMGYSRAELIAHLCEVPEAVVRNVLIAQEALSTDWRRLNRPSADDVTVLENELELYLTGDGILGADDEVVVYTSDGVFGQVAVRDIMLY